MRIWIDMTAPAHPIVFRPIIARLRAAGHDVEITARDYAQTLGLLHRLGLDHHAIGRHGGASRTGKLAALLGRTARMRSFGRRGFDLAAAHGSNDLPIVARALGIPAVDLFDYEWATFQHMIGCRLARRVIVPDAIPPERLRRYGAGPRKLRRYPGLKEEYFLNDFEPDPGILEHVGADAERIIVVLRTPPTAALYHRVHNPVYAELLDRIGSDPAIHAVVLPRLEEQAEELRRLALPSVIVPRHAVDGPSLVSAADLVISAGGSMNREAVALGVPVYTTFQGRMGGVDEQLLRQGKLRRLERAADVRIERRDRTTPRLRRDPQLIVDLILGTLD
jgi:predicted glycosyltransferase